MYRIVKTYLPSLFCRHFRCMHNRFSVLFTCDIMKRVEVASLFLWLAFNHILENIADNCNAYVKNFRYTKAVIPLWIYLSTWFAFSPADYELLLLLLMLHAMANDSHCWLQNFVCLRTNRTCRLFSTNYFNTLVKQFFGCFRVFFCRLLSIWHPKCALISVIAMEKVFWAHILCSLVHNRMHLIGDLILKTSKWSLIMVG